MDYGKRMYALCCFKKSLLYVFGRIILFIWYRIHCLSYTGHVHQSRYQHGKTYGNNTANLLAAYRQKKLGDSTLGVNGRGGDLQLPFPAYYQHEPSYVIGTRPRTWDRWCPQHKHELLNVSKREVEIREHNKVFITKDILE